MPCIACNVMLDIYNHMRIHTNQNLWYIKPCISEIMRIYSWPAYVSLIFFIARMEHPLHGKTTMAPLGILTTFSSWPLFLDTWTGETRMLSDARDRISNCKNISLQAFHPQRPCNCYTIFSMPIFFNCTPAPKIEENTIIRDFLSFSWV